MEYVFPSVVLGVSLLLDFVVYWLLPKNVKTARKLAAMSIVLTMFAVSSLLVLQLCLCSVLLLVIGVFRVVNAGRVVAARLHPKALKRKFGRSAVILGLFSAVVLPLVLIDSEKNVLTGLLILSVVGSAILLLNTLVSLVRWRSLPPRSKQLKDIPTVSVCIPARNETQDLPGCIESVLASTYPKLEILVLDDCSHDKTPQIIKKYAHEGVRFMKGTEPSRNWLAKNQAMNKLFDESRGDIVVFTGVDVRFDTNTVQRIVEQLDGDTSMLSILPRRSGAHELSLFIQPLRYWWELSVPRFRNGRPPVLSSCWAIKREQLIKVGEFESVKQSVQPERHFAKRLRRRYRFVLSGNRMGVTSVKKPREQFDTALRVRYPQAYRRPESALMLLVLQSVIFVTPIFGFVYGQTALALASIVLLTLCNLIISALTVRRTWIFGLFSLPFLVLEDWYVLIRSMLAYEFGIVRWKERNICLPMLQAEPKLPKIK